MLLELQWVEEKEWGRDRGGCSLKRMFVVVIEAGVSHSVLHW